MIPATLAELDSIVNLDDVTILVATGTHRGNTEAGLLDMFGPSVAGSVRIVNHDVRDRSTLTYLDTFGKDVPLAEQRWVEADMRITTGFVEPHFFAGFSGSPSSLLVIRASTAPPG